MLTFTEVVCLHLICDSTKEVLCTTIWCQIVIIAIILGDLKHKSKSFVFILWIKIWWTQYINITYLNSPTPIYCRCSRSNIECNFITCIRGIHVHYEYVFVNYFFSFKKCNIKYYLLCSPEFVPQITGGALFPGDVTLKISVWHCPFS